MPLHPGPNVAVMRKSVGVGEVQRMGPLGNTAGVSITHVLMKTTPPQQTR